MSNPLLQFLSANWTAGIEILLLAVSIYYGYLYFRGTRGAKVFTGLAILFIFLTLVSQILNLTVISWLLRSLTAFIAVALVVIFQPELRRALAELGSNHFFSSARQNRETIDIVADAVFELANKQLGALIAIERDTGIRSFAESGVNLDCEISQELLLTIFFPKTPLHDGGIIIRDDRIIAAACIFPVSQREDLDRTLGLRHRAGLGITEESDAIAIVVSEETGNVSICHRGKIERGFKPGNLEKRLGELLLRGDESANEEEELIETEKNAS
jgi:diadenylate cyclase